MIPIRRSEDPPIYGDNSIMEDHFILSLLRYVCIEGSLITLTHKISTVLFITLKYGALCYITLFGFPRCATNLISTNKNCSDVTSSTSSRCIALTVIQASMHTQGFFLCLFCMRP